MSVLLTVYFMFVCIMSMCVFVYVAMYICGVCNEITYVSIYL